MTKTFTIPYVREWNGTPHLFECTIPLEWNEATMMWMCKMSDEVVSDLQCAMDSHYSWCKGLTKSNEC